MALSCINNATGPRPWALTFSFGRALQDSYLNTWLGKDENIDAAQTALLARAQANSLASVGAYKGGVGGEAAKRHPFNFVDHSNEANISKTCNDGAVCKLGAAFSEYL